ncbi:dipeptidyl aminopeptidase/acylaminoacyl peptidase [Chthonomonas calidirosea]|uniref:prolyl oligopeptidase family serine peptidase n=1 Tax=Chthonomonas calidirosea TaxID=454171 RepID=UPI0006DD50F1|nr:prolyl oligopeptidase family serine peptidase [Chthonomonas calidirosea]CEK15450.1 dipeptidyl aminopeptidase/acylaminoacyl peptidase [Chthonomonas calidirosea]
MALPWLIFLLWPPFAAPLLTHSCPSSPPSSANTMLQAYQRAAQFNSEAMGRLVTNASIQPHWLPDGDHFWYASHSPKGTTFILVDASTGRLEPAFNASKVAHLLARITDKPVLPLQLPFSNFLYTPQRDAIAFELAGKWLRISLKDYSYRYIAMPKLSLPAVAPTQKPSPSAYPQFYLANNNIVMRISANDEKPLTTDGNAQNTYSAFSLSPNRRYLAAWRTVPGEHGEMYNVVSVPSNGSLRPTLRAYPYDLPGDRLDIHHLLLFDLQNGTEQEAKADPIDWGGPPEIRWQPDGQHFTYLQTYRGYHRVCLYEGDAATGAVRPLIDERSNTFVYPPCNYLKFLDSTHEIIWASERDGWCHLYLIDEQTGKVKNQITKGPWVVRSVLDVDAEHRRILFTACGCEPNQNPYYIHYYEVNFDGSGLRCLTPGNGQHTLQFSPNHRFYLDTYSRVDMPPITELRRTSDGALLCTLAKADVSRLLATGWRFPEPFHAKGRDGKTDIWGVIYRPSNFNPHKKYPVIEDIYAGPQDSFTPLSFSAQRADQALAELGFIVVQMDGMGTANRSKAFHDVCYKNLGDCGFPDRIAWMKAAAAKYPSLDLTRVGIYGMSAGGYESAHALLVHPEFYKVAVSMAGNHDSRTDKVWWNELWMGYPVGPQYAAQSNVTLASKLQGHLLLIHGGLDDNVNPFASTMQFVNALIQANKDFDMLFVPEAGHGFGPYVQRRMWDYFVQHLLHKKPPKEFLLTQGGDNGCTVTFRNLLDQPVKIYWINGSDRVLYHTLLPGQSVVQHSFIGHQWEAEVNGHVVAQYTVAAESPLWEILPETTYLEADSPAKSP